MMVQAAQHAGRHPGPLGYFFCKLARKKNRNIAVVATARKLVKIAYLMLKNNQPYRYAIPRRTEAKLAKLRVRATGQRRKSGVGRRTKAMAKLPGGGRTTKSLSEVYRIEGVPDLAPAPSGEARTIQAAGSTAFVATISRAQVIPYSDKAKKPPRKTACKTKP